MPRYIGAYRGGVRPSSPTTAYRTCALLFLCHSEPVLTLAWESASPVPCLSLWERWPSAARTERANKEGPPPGGPSFSVSINLSCHSEEHPKGYLLRGTKRRGNPHSFSCKFAEKRKNCAIWEQIATPVCGLARNDRFFRQPVSTRSVDGWIVISRAGQSRPPLHTPTDSLCAIRAGRCGHPPLRNHRRRMRHTHGRTDPSAPIHGFPAAKYFQPAAKGRHPPLPLRGKGAI